MSNKYLYYIGIAAFIIFIIFFSLKGISTPDDSFDEVRLSVEWITKFVLPWIFLYWFVKMVRKMK
ncbi:hypothetical protein [Paenibacillus sp. GCM10028914]|uniref:hypothetical protein n=1 Tax=Paenibacillus sp. GCM10028914 TaxID=3273416 RepID=UPI00360FAA82